jgi:hypothetical protein
MWSVSSYRKILVALVAALMLVFVAGCEPPPDDAEERERQTQEENHANLQSNQPAETMDYSPTREGINYWINTWEEEGKLSYVYLLASNGQKIGYYVLEGLPISYCASLTPTQRIETKGVNDAAVVVQNPSMDGVWYSGGQCTQYFGKDALTGSYVEWTVGTGISQLVTEQPLPAPEAEPLTTTSVEDVEKQQ